jgi:hypothetical protein
MCGRDAYGSDAMDGVFVFSTIDSVSSGQSTLRCEAVAKAKEWGWCVSD